MIILKKDENGIFSNFLRVIDWFCYQDYTGEEIFIDWNYNNIDLLSIAFDYEKPKNLENPKVSTNNWVNYTNFTKEIGYQNFVKKIPFYSKYNGYFYTTPEIYKESDFQILRDDWNYIFNKYLKFKESFVEKIKNKNLSDNERILGVHLRSPQHYCHNVHNGPQLQADSASFYLHHAMYVKKYFEENNFDKIYVGCDIVDFINYLKLHIPNDKLLFHEYERGTGNNDWRDKNNFSYEQEVFNCFADTYNLSHCNELIMSTSNMVLGILIINNKIKFSFFPTLENFHGM